MRRSRRGCIDMLVSILNAVSEKPLIATHIAYNVRLNYSTSTEFLERLVNKGLIKQVMNDKQQLLYCITEKGIQVLKNFRAIELAVFEIQECKVL